MPSLFIATPVYGAPTTAYTQSLIATIPALETAGFAVVWKAIEGCCYVHTARNKLARDFLMSGAEALLFLDADIGWQADELVRLCRRDRDVVGAAAPFRTGEAGFPVRPLTDGEGYPRVDPADGLVRVDVLPTAVMKIRRQVLLDLARAGKAPLRIEYDRRTGAERERYLSFFDFEADEPRAVEFGEDVTFCRKWLSLGGELWLEPDMTIRHTGLEARTGNYHDWLRALPGGGGPAPAEWTFAPRTGEGERRWR